MRRGRLRQRRARAAGGDVRDQPVDRVRRGAGRRSCARWSRSPGSTRSGWTARPSGGDPVIRVDTGIAQYFGVGAYLRDLPDARHSGVRFASECLAFSNLPDPVVGPGGRAAGQRRRLGLRGRARALPARALRRRRHRGRRAAGHRRGDGRRVRRVAAPGLGRAAAASCSGCATSSPVPAGDCSTTPAHRSPRRWPSRRRSSRPRSGSSTRGSTASTCTSPTTRASPST